MPPVLIGWEPATPDPPGWGGAEVAAQRSSPRHVGQIQAQRREAGGVLRDAYGSGPALPQHAVDQRSSRGGLGLDHGDAGQSQCAVTVLPGELGVDGDSTRGRRQQQSAAAIVGDQHRLERAGGEVGPDRLPDERIVHEPAPGPDRVAVLGEVWQSVLGDQPSRPADFDFQPALSGVEVGAGPYLEAPPPPVGRAVVAGQTWGVEVHRLVLEGAFAVDVQHLGVRGELVEQVRQLVNRDDVLAVHSALQRGPLDHLGECDRSQSCQWRPGQQRGHRTAPARAGLLVPAAALRPATEYRTSTTVVSLTMSSRWTVAVCTRALSSCSS